MKVEKKNSKSLDSANKRQNQPFLEQKLEEANQLLKRVGLPKELEK